MTDPQKPSPDSNTTRQHKKPTRYLALREDIPKNVYIALGAGFILLLLVAWQIVTSSGLIRPLFLPPPANIATEGLRQINEGILWADASASIYRIVMGWGFATLFAVPIGILMGNFKFFEGLFEPFIDIVRYMPVVALIPLTILWAGIGDFQKFLILFIGTFFQQVLMVMDNVKSVPISLIKVGQTLGLSRFEILKSIVLPAAMPKIWDTFRITMGWTWTYLVVAELVAANNGLGRRIMDAQRYLATDTIIFGILFIGFLGLITDYIFKLSGKVLFKWNKGQ
ncbi:MULTISPECIES: ABC transporter permease [Desulfosediminicola]|uniref:ABC transporter permease n=1 Tax=Desulfosediminicola TaxID=2886823 RepID=UPI0010AD1A98|nr:ABC transporter permease [Desulfosediminicola ganghwensis]